MILVTQLELPTYKDIFMEFVGPVIIVAVVIVLLSMAFPKLIDRIFGTQKQRIDPDEFMIAILTTLKEKFNDDLDYPGKYVRSEIVDMILRFETERKDTE